MTRPNLPLIVYHFIQARQRWHRLRGSALANYQEKRIHQIINYAHQHSSFYRKHWNGYDLQDWENLPTVDKQIMMQNFDEFNTRGITYKEAMEVALQAERSRDFTPTVRGVIVGLSSGTSGHRGIFLANAWEQAAWAGNMISRALPRLPRHRLRVAFFLRSNSNLYEQVGSLLIQFRYIDLMLPLDQAVQTLNEFQPHLIIGPPSLLKFLAEEREHGRLHCQPQRLISVAEVLEPQVREYLRETFMTPIHQIYQCTEGFLAISCAYGSLHIQEDIVKIQLEPLPGDEKRFTPIVTDLWRQSQPVIRYRLNDILRLDPAPCPCGSSFRVIAQIEGRCDDICTFITQDGEERPFYPDTIRRMILLASDSIKDYQVEQRQAGQLSIRLAPGPGASWEQTVQAVQESVQKTLAQYNCRSAILEFINGVEIPPAGTKLRRVRRLASST